MSPHPVDIKRNPMWQQRPFEEKCFPRAESWVAHQSSASIDFISLVGGFIKGMVSAQKWQNSAFGVKLIDPAPVLMNEPLMAFGAANEAGRSLAHVTRPRGAANVRSG